jgi:hypothetical protein
MDPMQTPELKRVLDAIATKAIDMMQNKDPDEQMHGRLLRDVCPHILAWWMSEIARDNSDVAKMATILAEGIGRMTFLCLGSINHPNPVIMRELSDRILAYSLVEAHRRASLGAGVLPDLSGAINTIRDCESILLDNFKGAA